MFVDRAIASPEISYSNVYKHFAPNRGRSNALGLLQKMALLTEDGRMHTVFYNISLLTDGGRRHTVFYKHAP